MSDTDIRKQYGVTCHQCGLQLQNSMEQLVGLCPFCFRVNYLEKQKWVIGNRRAIIQIKKKCCKCKTANVGIGYEIKDCSKCGAKIQWPKTFPVIQSESEQ